MARKRAIASIGARGNLLFAEKPTSFQKSARRRLASGASPPPPPPPPPPRARLLDERGRRGHIQLARLMAASWSTSVRRNHAGVTLLPHPSLARPRRRSGAVWLWLPRGREARIAALASSSHESAEPARASAHLRPQRRRRPRAAGVAHARWAIGAAPPARSSARRRAATRLRARDRAHAARRGAWSAPERRRFRRASEAATIVP